MVYCFETLNWMVLLLWNIELNGLLLENFTICIWFLGIWVVFDFIELGLYFFHFFYLYVIQV